MFEEMERRISELHAEICKTLSSPIRLDILNLLRDGEKTVTVLAEALGIRQANLSQHLAVLRQRRMVTTRRAGTSIYYRVTSPKIIQACDLMRDMLFEQLKETEELVKLASPAAAR